MEALTMEEMMEGKEVIDWDEAMEQCGDDEIFLRELLADLRVEVGTQLAKMEEILKVSHDFIAHPCIFLRLFTFFSKKKMRHCAPIYFYAYIISS
mmetsp:Transcript_63925/g.94923  ORF Transcript_63925/g.94923 Transcript_63925/m.94923 type:complete len:95 (-) Transcript_63925:72-356(-)